MTLTYRPTFHLNEVESFATLCIDNYKNAHNIQNGVLAYIRIKYNDELISLVNELRAYVEKESKASSEVTVNFVTPYLIEIYNNDSCYLSMTVLNEETNIFESSVISSIRISIYGSYDKSKDIYDHLKANYKKDGPEVSWSYKDSDGGLRSSYFNLSTDKEFYPEFYPFIKDVKSLGKRFLDSDANILILLGPPGTGKTSLIRNMLVTLNTGAMTTYDDDIMAMDRFYITYLNSAYNFVVLEDSDLLLTTREKDDNRVMNKILNTSDGLISTKDKKFIFTANITQENRIDEALIRPGRCFDVIHFRDFTNAEAQIAAEKIGVTLPDDKDEYSLAEIFNTKKKKRARMGF